MNNPYRIIETRILYLEKWEREMRDEFIDFESFYSVEFIKSKMHEISNRIEVEKKTLKSEKERLMKHKIND